MDTKGALRDGGDWGAQDAQPLPVAGGPRRLLNTEGGARTRAGAGLWGSLLTLGYPWGEGIERGGASADSAATSEALCVGHAAPAAAIASEGPLTPLGQELLVPAVSIATAAARGAGLVNWAWVRPGL